MQTDIATNEATLTAHVSNIQIHHLAPPPDPQTDRAPTRANGDIRAGLARRASPGAASAAASALTR
eukprot:1554502-Pyramimonas_sp.AAC.1